MLKVLSKAIFVCSAGLVAFSITELIAGISLLSVSTEAFFSRVHLLSASNSLALAVCSMAWFLTIQDHSWLRTSIAEDKEWRLLFKHTILAGVILSVLVVVKIIEVPFVTKLSYLTLIGSVWTIATVVPIIWRKMR